VPRAATPTCEAGTEGWVYSPDGRNIVLCEPTCARIKGSPDPQLDVLFGCESKTDDPR